MAGGGGGGQGAVGQGGGDRVGQRVTVDVVGERGQIDRNVGGVLGHGAGEVLARSGRR